MNFKDLKSGHSIYVFDKNNIAYKAEKVMNVSLPHADAKMSTMGMVVDVTTESGTYCMVADSEVAYPCNHVITTDKVNILREVESMCATAQQRIDNIDADKECVSKCKKLIADLDPSQREKQVNEARFSNIEASITQMMAMLKKLSE